MVLYLCIHSKWSVCCCLMCGSVTALQSKYYYVYGFWNTSLYKTITKWCRCHKCETTENPTVDQRQKQLFVTIYWGHSGSLWRLSGVRRAIHDVLEHCSMKNHPRDVVTPYTNRTTTPMLRLQAPHAWVKLEILGHVAVHREGILCYNIIIGAFQTPVAYEKHIYHLAPGDMPQGLRTFSFRRENDALGHTWICFSREEWKRKTWTWCSGGSLLK
jgi:hypothetical protein